MPEPSLIRVAAVQMEPRLGDLGENLDGILAKLEEAIAGGARLVAFPECALTGYCLDSKEEALGHAEPIPGPSTREVAAACSRSGAFAIYGLLERDGDRLFNACVLVGPGGVIGSYRKIHLPYMGVDRFADPGDRALEVLDAGGVRVGLHICYDGTFPETGRILSLLGADLLVLPTNWPTQTESVAEHLAACRALENVVYAMAVNRIGEERGVRFIGRSSIAGPGGEILARASVDAAEILFADVDPIRARTKRLVRVPGKQFVDRIADRRPGFYGPIVAPNGKD